MREERDRCRGAGEEVVANRADREAEVLYAWAKAACYADRGEALPDPPPPNAWKYYESYDNLDNLTNLTNF